MEAKEETSDTDSGIILHSGPDSPCTVMKDVTTHTRAVRLKLQSLEEHLDACVLELKRLCIREAELMGQLSSDYPLLPGEKPPQVRRRIGATFRLDEQSLLERTEPSALSAVEAELGLQQQIVVAARGLVQEGALNKAVRRSRQQQCRVEESKLKQLQDLVFHLRMQHGRTSPHPAMAAQRDHAISDDRSVADSAVLDDEERASQASQPSLELPPLESAPVSGPAPHHTHTHTHTPPQTLALRASHNHLPSPTRSPSLNHSHITLSPSLNHSHITLSPSPSHNHTILSPSPSHSHVTLSPSPSHTHILTSPIPSPTPSPGPSHRTHSPSSSLSLSIGGLEEDDRPPIENSPWAESSLDQPYEKIKKKRSSSRRSNSPAVTPTLPPLELCVCVEDSSRPLPLPSHVRATQSNSAPCTPELQLRRGLSLRLPSSGYDVDQDRGRSRFPRRRVTDLGMSPEYSPLHVGVGNLLYHSSSEDSASEHSGASYTSSPCREAPADPPHLNSPAYGHPDPYGHNPNDRYAHPPNDRYAHPPNDRYAHPPNGFYRNPQHQSTPTFSRGCPPHGRAYAPEAGRHDYWYEPAPVTLPAHVRLSRAPSLREYPAHHPPCHPAHHPAHHPALLPALPRQLVSEQLKSWHQRQQLQRPSRPRSLDRHRQGALRIRNSTGRDSPLALQPRRLDQKGLAPRVVDQNSGQWTTEDDALIISQV
ncbi:innate immunity activator b isoform X2 [Alosa sapidissima]|uniref:innate immunity activator b isoform X2 n=1 Tax=Alosa sapidissima TaxID=34773 RepID=UPI001C0A5D01|nr:innate immunity activator b isoform X2 [Alosa sapidissima]